MKVLFSNPPWWSLGAVLPNGRQIVRQGRRAGSRWPFTMQAHYMPDEYRPGGYYPFPFFMGYAASYVQKVFRKEAKIVFRDSITRGESYVSYGNFAREFAPDFIFIEAATSSWDHDQQIIGQLAKMLPEVKIVLCGPISETAHEKQMDGKVWAYIKGEYEKGAVRVLQGERGVIAHDLLSTEEMNAAPIPMMDKECWDHYWDANPKGQIQPHLQIWSSRGCRFLCSFCSWPAIMTNNDPMGVGGRKIRLYSPEYMQAYLQEMTKRHSYRSILVDDDTTNLSDRHVLGLSGVLAKIGLPWGAMCRADTIKRETWQAMKDSGCTGVKLGFESGSQRVIDEVINKKLDLKAAADTARWLRSIGIAVHGTFTIFLPGETDMERKMTMDFIQDLYKTGGLDTHQLSGTATLDGTPLANMKKGEALPNFPGAIKDDDWIDNPDGVLKAEQM